MRSSHQCLPDFKPCAAERPIVASHLPPMLHCVPVHSSRLHETHRLLHSACIHTHTRAHSSFFSAKCTNQTSSNPSTSINHSHDAAGRPRSLRQEPKHPDTQHLSLLRLFIYLILTTLSFLILKTKPSGHPTAL